MEVETKCIKVSKSNCILVIIITCVTVLLVLCTIAYLSKDEKDNVTVPKKIIPLYSPTTFTVCEETDARKHLYYHSSYKPTSDASVIIGPLVNNHQFYQVLQSTRFSKSSFPLPGFVRSVVECHSYHNNIIVRPDDIWAAIMSDFSWYALVNPEKVGSDFSKLKLATRHTVPFESSGETLSYEGMMLSFYRNYSYGFENDTLRNWILPDFSTTTENDNFTIWLMVTGTMKGGLYEGKKVRTKKCGIPNITLDGTVEDWAKIRRRLEKLNDYGLQKWYGLLRPIITQFMKAKDGNVDGEFWKEIVQFEELDHRYVTGWITSFCVLYTLQSEEYGGVKWRENQNLEWFTTSAHSKKWPAIVYTDIPDGVASMDFVGQTQEGGKNGEFHKATLFAGHLAAELKEDGKTIQPALGWAMVLQRG